MAAQEKGSTALAFTNINATPDVWEFVALCRTAGIKPVAGTGVRNGNRRLYLLLAAAGEGLARIPGFLSRHLTEKKDLTEPDAQPVFSVIQAMALLFIPFEIE